MDDVGRRIEYAREFRKMTVSELAHKIDVDQRQLRQWERGVRNPKEGVRIKIAEALNVQIDYFLANGHYSDPPEMIAPYLRDSQEAMSLPFHVFYPYETLHNGQFHAWNRSALEDNSLSEEDHIKIAKLINKLIHK